MDRLKVMIVEDDPFIRDLAAEALRRWELEVCLADPSEDVAARFVREAPQLVVLDVGLPRLDGFEWCSRIRAVSRAPILFISALSGSQAAVRALAEGGDDWLSKPFELELLVAKVKALLRRAYSWAPECSRLLERRGLLLDCERRLASYEGRSVELGGHGSALLKRLLERDGRVATRDELMDALWSADEFVDDNTLTVNVTRLRKELATIGADAMVETVRGSGYRII
ncbi:MAG: response regulator transcription factor [Spirochaetaceae bacterium]|nr:response regulator transcription factor [Spirochaetaceae bacterium]